MVVLVVVATVVFLIIGCYCFDCGDGDHVWCDIGGCHSNDHFICCAVNCLFCSCDVCFLYWWCC